MSIIGQLLRGGIAAEGNPNDERYWSPVASNPMSVAGVLVTAETALRASAVWACTRLIAESVAALPIGLYERQEGARRLAPNHPLYDVIHQQPNEEQTALEFWETAVTHILIRGSAYARKVAGARGPTSSLVIIPPEYVTPEMLPSGRLRYTVLNPQTGERPPVLREDLFVGRGLSLDGMTGVSVLTYARDSIGLAMATEGYGARVFSQNATPGGVLEFPGRLTPEIAARLNASWQQTHGGLGNAHRIAVLEQGMAYKQVSMTSDDAQFLQTREFQVEDVARWFRVPPHMIGNTTKATSWGSGIEQMSIGFVSYTLLPWLKRLEQSIGRDLILAPDRYYAEFRVDGLLRGDTASRYAAYATARQWGWLSVNDIRRLENMNPVPGGDAYLQPMNMVPAGAVPEAAMAALPVDEQRSAIGPHYRLLIEDAAERMVYKEVTALRKAASRHAASSADWAAAVGEFYEHHAAHVAAALHVPLAEGRAWAEQRRAALLTSGPVLLEQWEREGAAVLAALVMEVQR